MPLPPEVMEELFARCEQHKRGIEMGPGVGETTRIAVFNARGQRVADCVVSNAALEQDFIDAAERLAGEEEKPNLKLA